MRLQLEARLHRILNERQYNVISLVGQHIAQVALHSTGKAVSSPLSLAVY